MRLAELFAGAPAGHIGIGGVENKSCRLILVGSIGRRNRETAPAADRDIEIGAGLRRLGQRLLTRPAAGSHPAAAPGRPSVAIARCVGSFQTARRVTSCGEPRSSSHHGSADSAVCVVDFAAL